MFRAPFIFCLLLGVGAVAAADDAAGYYSNPARDIEFSNVQHLAKSPRILVPTLYVKFARWGRAPLTTVGTNAGGAIVDVDAPVAIEAVRGLAARLREDLIANLKNAGWQILTEQDIKDRASWTKVERAKPDKRFGVPFEQGTVGGNQRRYLIVAPDNLEVIAAGATGPAWALKDLVGELDATVLVATYTFDVIPSVGASGAADPVTPRLQLVEVNFDFRAPGLVGGTIRAKIPQLAQHATGKFNVPGVGDDKRAAALTEASTGKGKGELVLEPDPATLVSTGLEVGGSFNAQVVSTIAAFAPQQ